MVDCRRLGLRLACKKVLVLLAKLDKETCKGVGATYQVDENQINHGLQVTKEPKDPIELTVSLVSVHRDAQAH